MSTTHYYWGFPAAIPVPTITAISPATGAVTTTVTITGTNLTNATALTFNGVAATSFTVMSATSINTTVPTGATSGTITVTTAGGTATSAGSFTVTSAGATGKILYIAIGDSITNGDFANPGYVVATMNRLGNPTNVTLRKRGFSGKTSEWYRNNELVNDLAFIDANIASYDRIVVTHAFGANDLTNQYSTTEAKGVQNVYDSFKATAAAFNAKGAKIVVIFGPVMNRVDSYSTPTFDQDRTQVNNLLKLNYTSYAKDYVDPAGEPIMWGSNAPNSTVYFYDKVHPQTAGAAIMAEQYAYTLAPWFGLVLNPAYQANIGVTATSGGSGTVVNDSLPPDPNLLGYGYNNVINTVYNTSTQVLAKTTTGGTDHAWDGVAQYCVQFGAGKIHVHIPSAGLAYNPSDPWQSAIVSLLAAPYSATYNPSLPYTQGLVGWYKDAQKCGPIEKDGSVPVSTTPWPTQNFPNLDITVDAADAQGNRKVIYYEGDRPVRTTSITATTLYLYAFVSTNGGSIITNMTVSGDNITIIPASATSTAAAAGPVAYPAGGINAATFAADVLTGTSTTAFAAYANASTKINTLLGYVDISFPTASRAGGAFVSLFAAPLTGTGNNAYFTQLAGLYMNTDGTVNGFTGSTGGTAIAGGGQTARIRVDSTGINMFLGAATTAIFSYPPNASVYYLAGILYLNGSELKNVTLSGPGLVLA